MAWWTRLPSILILLATGLLVGPVARLFTPMILHRSVSLNLNDAIATDPPLNLVSLAVGLFLFGGGLSFNFRGTAGVRRVVCLLVTLGAIVTSIVSTLSAKYLLDLKTNVAVLLGAASETLPTLRQE